MSTTTERGSIEGDLRTAIADLAHHNYPHFEQAVWELLDRYTAEQDAAFADLEDRNQTAEMLIAQLQVRLARNGYYDAADSCAAILDVLNGVER